MPRKPYQIGVVIVDNHPMTRIGLTFMLKTFDDIGVLGEAERGSEVLELCVQKRPDVVVMDMMLPDGEGPTFIRILRQQLPSTQVIALSSFGERTLVEQALHAGAISYLLKNVTAHELAEAIRKAIDGKATLAAEALQALVEQIQRPQPLQVEFTEREQTVFELLAQGLSNGQIALQLHLSAATVKGHVGAILAKLGVNTRAEAIALSWSRGMVASDRK